MRIVLIEDLVDVAKVMTLLLIDLGHEVITFHSMPPALQYLAEGRPCDLVITDYNIPDFPADNVVQRLGETTPAPILVYTGSSAGIAVIPPEYRQRTRVLQKPFQMEELVDAIRQLTGG